MANNSITQSTSPSGINIGTPEFRAAAEAQSKERQAAIRRKQRSEKVAYVRVPGHIGVYRNGVVPLAAPVGPDLSDYDPFAPAEEGK